MVSYSYFYRSMALWSHDWFLPCCLTMRRSNPARWNVLQLQLTHKWLQIWPRFETSTKMTLTLRHWHCNRRNLPNSMIRTLNSLLSNTIWWCNPNIFSLKPNGQLDFNDSAAVRWVFFAVERILLDKKGNWSFNRQLTVSLLEKDFGLEVKLPDDRLCPPVCSRKLYSFAISKSWYFFYAGSE